MKLRSFGAVAILLSAVASPLAAAAVSRDLGLLVALIVMAGLAARVVRLGRAFVVEQSSAAKNGFLARMPAELSGASDAAEVWQRALSRLGAFVGATRVALFRQDGRSDAAGFGNSSYRLYAQFAVEDMRPLDPSSCLPSRLDEEGVDPAAGPDKQVTLLPSGDAAGAGEMDAIVIYRSSADEAFLERFHACVRHAAGLVERRASHARLAELRGALLHLAHALASTQESEATLDLTVTASAPLARCQGGAIFVDQEASGWRTAAAYGFVDRLTPAVLSRLLPKLDEAASERVPIRFHDGALSFLVAPMFHGRELVGVLMLGRDDGNEDWDETDLEAARVTAQLTATSLKSVGRMEDLVGTASQGDDVAEIAFDLQLRIDEQGFIRGANTALLDALRSTRSELEGRRFEDLLDRRGAKAWRDASRKLFRGGSLRGGSLRGEALGLVDHEGERVDVLLNAFALSPSEACLVMKDVSDSESLRLQLQQSQKQEVLGLLASGIAHDLNNVLGGVLGYASLARRQSTDPQVVKYAGTIERTAMRGASLTGRLLSASRRSGTRYEPVSLNHLARETLEILSHSIPKNITIETHFDPAVRVMMADPGQLQQVLLNLCVNARDAMSGGGVLRLTTRFDGADGRVHISIEDTGVGMEPKTLERLFEPFFSTKGASGTGLGLSVVYNIVKSLSGEIRVQSAPGKGSRFDIFLPGLWADETSEAPELDEPLGHGELVLLVDDEKVMRELGRDILLAQGYRVEAVSSGEAAISFVRRHWERIALVVLDLVMPGLDGTETYRRLKAFRPAIPVLLSSGLSAEEAVTDFLDDASTAFLGKPYGTAELARAVHGAITATKGPSAVVH